MFRSQGGSHSHQKRIQLSHAIQQQAQSAAGGSVHLSGIPIQSPDLYHATSQPNLGDGHITWEDEYTSQAAVPPSNISEHRSASVKPTSRPSTKIYSRASTGYFSMGGVSQFPPRFTAVPALTTFEQRNLIGTHGDTLTINAPSVKLSSRSLGASKATMPSGGNVSIQKEYHSYRVRSMLSDPWSGEGRLPLIRGIIFLIIFVLVAFAGAIVIILRQQGTIFFTADREDIVGPILCAGSLLFFAIAIRFFYSAYHIRAREIRKLRFQASRATHVAVKLMKKSETNETILSGTKSIRAVDRKPVPVQYGSAHSLPMF